MTEPRRLRCVVEFLSLLRWILTRSTMRRDLPSHLKPLQEALWIVSCAAERAKRKMSPPVTNVETNNVFFIFEAAVSWIF